MANPPIIVNKRPREGDTGVNALSPIRFGLRDEETRVDLATTYSSLHYARAVYRPDVLPELDPALSAENIRTVFSIFNDAAGAGLPNNPADQTIEIVGPDTTYRIERTIGGAQEGFLYVEDDYQGEFPYAAEAKLDLAVYSIGGASYVTYADYTGVMFGLIAWPKNSGVFLFFRDNGTKRISIAGPSSDGIGTRPVETTVIFDWAADIYTYRIFWDETPSRRKVVVLAVDSAGEATRLAEFLTTSMPQFLPSVVLGGQTAEEPPNKVVMVVGTDGPTPGDYVDIYKADLFRFGRPIVIAGGPTGSSFRTVHPTESLLTHTVEALAEWNEDGEGEASLSGIAVALVRDPELASPDVFKYTRVEPDLTKQEWLIIASIRGQNSQHLGTFNTAMGFDIEDGTYRHSLRLLDNFFVKDIGLYDVGNFGDDDSYLKAPSPIDWEESGDVQVILLGSASHAAIRGYIENDDESVTLDVGSYTATLLSTEFKLSFGFLESDFEYYGKFNFIYFWAFTNVTFYEPVDATFPELQGWTRVSVGGSRSLGDRLELDYTTVGDYDIYYFADPDYSEDSGLAAYCKLRVTAWTDAGGAVSPPRKEIGPILHLTSSTDGVQLRFVETEIGRRFAYISGTVTDVNDVIAQNADGVRLSTELDFTQDHVYMLVLKPFQHIRLYVDYSTTPSIDIPWESKGLAFRTFPTNLPAGATGAFGSLGETSGVQMEVAFSRISVGTGYDLTITPEFTEEQREDHIYGSEAEVFIDFEDEDP